MKKLISIALVLSLTLIPLAVMTSCGVKYYDETVKFNKGDCLVVAHRGLCGMEVENTDAAFIAAGERSYYGIEADIRKTQDGRFVVCHDETLTRISGRNIKLEGSAFSKLSEVVLYDKDGKRSGSTRLATLESYISICKAYGKHCFLEMKSDFSAAEAAQIVDIIRGFDYLDKVTFISFEYQNLLNVRATAPGQSAQLLFSKITDEITSMLIRDGIDASVSYSSLTEEAISTFHNAGLRVGCWTVDDKKAAERLASWGVDYITTNILE